MAFRRYQKKTIEELKDMVDNFKEEEIPLWTLNKDDCYTILRLFKSKVRGLENILLRAENDLLNERLGRVETLGLSKVLKQNPCYNRLDSSLVSEVEWRKAHERSEVNEQKLITERSV